MTPFTDTLPGQAGTIPQDNQQRELSVVSRDLPGMRHISIVGDVYTILLSGQETAGHYCLVDMRVPHCNGPGPHRHDFEEMFTLLEGEIEFAFRGEKTVVKAGMTVNIPANAPHFFTNIADTPARMLCMCTPAGQEDFFLAIGTPVDSHTAEPPKLSDSEMTAWQEKASALAPLYRTELLAP